MQGMVVEGLEAFHLAGGERNIPIQRTGEEDHALHMVGRMIMTRTGGAGNAPGRLDLVATLDRAKLLNNSRSLSHPAFTCS